MATIVLVEDNLSQLRAVSTYLEHEGHSVRAVSTYEDAEAAICDLKYCDCVVLDIWLNGKSGVDLIGQIRESEKKLPIIVVSGGNFDVPLEQTHLAATWRGSTEFLFKPFELRELLETIESVIAEKAA